MIALEREVPVVVLRANISEAGEHLFAFDVRLGNDPDYFARVNGESEEPDDSG